MPIKKYKPVFTFFTPQYEGNSAIPYVDAGVSAGFASPAQDFMEVAIDLNAELSHNRSTTFYIRVSGNSMINAGIENGDLLVVDRSLEPADGKIAICLIDGDFTVKRLKLQLGSLCLIPENPHYPVINVTEHNQFTVWAIVTYVIKAL